MPRILIVTLICGLIGATTVQATPRQGVDAGETAAGNPDKIVCKRFVRIGSLVDGYRTCKTKKEWERERAEHQDLSKAYSCRVVDDKAAPCK
jgi:hypothetical protein